MHSLPAEEQWGERKDKFNQFHTAEILINCTMNLPFNEKVYLHRPSGHLCSTKPSKDMKNGEMSAIPKDIQQMDRIVSRKDSIENSSRRTNGPCFCPRGNAFNATQNSFGSIRSPPPHHLRVSIAFRIHGKQMNNMHNKSWNDKPSKRFRRLPPISISDAGNGARVTPPT